MTPAEKRMRDTALGSVAAMSDQKLAATLKHHGARSTDHSVRMSAACRAERARRAASAAASHQA